MKEKSRPWAFLFYFLMILAGTILFFYARSYCHETGRYSLIWLSGAIYGVFMLSSGFLFGYSRRSNEENHSAGFLYHLSAYTIFNGIWLLWIRMGMATPSDSYATVSLIMTAWGLGILLHLTFFIIRRRHMIRGMERDEIFE